MVPTTLAGHRFWVVGDKQERAQRQIHFLKNLTIMGGLLIAAADTGRARRRLDRRPSARRTPQAVTACCHYSAGGRPSSAAVLEKGLHNGQVYNS